MPKMRLGWYAGASTALAGSVVISAFYQRPNFYSAMVHLAQSNFCLLVLVNFTLFVYSSFAYGLSRLCFGRLRAVEVEQLTERAWFAITETCLAMTTIRDERGAWFLVMFTALVTGKVWGWICDGRVEILEQQPPANPRLFHTRLSISLLMSFVYDVSMLRYIILQVIREARPNMMVIFLFEFAVLTACSWRTGVRYILSIAEQNIIKAQTRKRLLERKEEVRQERLAMTRQREEAVAAGEEPPESQEPLPHEDEVDEMDIEVPGWAAKGEFVLWLDLITDMTKLGIYVAFFFMLLRFYGFPIHIIRDLFMTSRDFIKRLNALLRYRRAIQEMNRHPDATEEDLARESTCIICREEMRPWDPVNNPGAIDRTRPKKLPCGHILHLGCLKSWLERQQVCPTCRAPVTEERDRGAQRNNRGANIRIQIGINNRPQPPPNNPPAHGPNDPPAQAAQGNGGPRVFNLGPLRLGFGANGQQVRDLVQQLGIQQGNQAPGVVPAPLPVQDQPALGQAGRQQRIQSIATHISQAGELLQREVQALQNSQQELTTLTLLLTELQRVQQRAENQVDPSAIFPAQAAVPNIALPAGFQSGHQVAVHNPLASLPGVPPFSALPPRISTPFVARHGTASNATAIPAGSPDLPEGVVIPQGWSLMPLQRLDGNASSNTPMPPTPQSMAQQQPQPQPTATTSPPPPNGENALDGSNAGQSSTSSTGVNTNVGNDAQSTGATSPTAASASTPAPAPASRPVEPTPVVSPSPVLPNWGGPAQLFSNGPRLDPAEGAAPPLSQPQASGPTSAEQEADDSSSAESDDTSPEQSAPASAPASEKGKAKAATVEDDDDSASD